PAWSACRAGSPYKSSGFRSLGVLPKAARRPQRRLLSGNFVQKPYLTLCRCNLGKRLQAALRFGNANTAECRLRLDAELAVVPVQNSVLKNTKSLSTA